MPNWDCSPTARHRSFTPVSLLGHDLEARVGIGPETPLFGARMARSAARINLSLSPLERAWLISIGVRFGVRDSLANRSTRWGRKRPRRTGGRCQERFVVFHHRSRLFLSERAPLAQMTKRSLRSVTHWMIFLTSRKRLLGSPRDKARW